MRQPDATHFILSLGKSENLATNETTCNGDRLDGDGLRFRQFLNEKTSGNCSTPQRTRLRFCACRHGRPGTTSWWCPFEWGHAHGTMPPMAHQALRIGPAGASGTMALPAPCHRFRRAGGPCWRESAPTPRGPPSARWKRFRGGHPRTTRTA